MLGPGRDPGEVPSASGDSVPSLSGAGSLPGLVATPLSQVVQTVARAMGMNRQEIERRKAFLGLAERDVSLLLELHDRLSHGSESFAEAFYAHLLAFGETRSFLADPATVARLKRSQAAYFESLTAGAYDLDYVHHRLRVGVTHHRIGLGPQWYLGAYNTYLSCLMASVWETAEGDLQKAIDTVRALVKVVFFDIGLTLDTYAHVDRRTIAELQVYAERLVTSIPSGLLVLSADLRVLFANRAFLDMVDVSPDRAVGMPLEMFFPGVTWWDRVARVLGVGDTHSRIDLDLVAGGATRQVQITLAKIDASNSRDTEPESDGPRLLLVLDDVTERKQAEAALRASEDRYRALVENAHDMIQSVGPDGRFLFVNRAWMDTMGYTEEEVRLLNLLQIIHPRSQSHCQQVFADIVAGASTVEVQAEFVAKDGRSVLVEGSVTSRYVDGRLIATQAIFRNITERRALEARLHHVASHDALTNLPNRAVFMDRLNQALVRVRRSAQPLAVLVLDLDRFKLINDTLGHASGDRLILAVAQRLSECLRDGDTVARLGGDEFAVLLPELAKAGDIVTVVDKIFATLKPPFLIDGHELFVTTSIGISIAPDDGEEAGGLVKNADAAMYRAKDQGRNIYQLYSPAMNVSTLERLSLESSLRRALDRREFVVHYQPQVDIPTWRICGVEALVRWQHQDLGLVSPGRFIPLAEETGLIVPIGEVVLRAACAQHRAWRDAGFPSFPISVNLSARQFRQADLKDRIARIVHEAGLDPGQLELELTESLLMDHTDLTVETLDHLHAMGVRLSIDDFGVGYSSLSYLKRFPIQTLKIDQSFVRHVTSDADDGAISTAIIAMAHSLRLRVVAEGVETEDQLAFLMAKGCDAVQGYLFSQPLAADAMTALLETGRGIVKPASGSSGISGPSDPQIRRAA